MERAGPTPTVAVENWKGYLAAEVPPEKSGVPAPHWGTQSEFQCQEEKSP